MLLSAPRGVLRVEKQFMKIKAEYNKMNTDTVWRSYYYYNKFYTCFMKTINSADVVVLVIRVYRSTQLTSFVAE